MLKFLQRYSSLQLLGVGAGICFISCSQSLMVRLSISQMEQDVAEQL
jgi:hypothetical protein